MSAAILPPLLIYRAHVERGTSRCLDKTNHLMLLLLTI
jgi:hypothetical protein